MGLYIWPPFPTIPVFRKSRLRFIAKGKRFNTMVLSPLSYAAIVGSGNKAAPPIFPTPTPMKKSPARSVNSGVQSISSPQGPTRDHAAALPPSSQTLEIQQDRPQIALFIRTYRHHGVAICSKLCYSSRCCNCTRGQFHHVKCWRRGHNGSCIPRLSRCLTGSDNDILAYSAT